MAATDECPNCGAEFRRGRLACPECGSDARTGWKSPDEFDYQSIEIPDAFDEADLGLRRGPRLGWVAVVLLIAFGALTSIQAPKLATGMPTPWLGAWERVDIGVFLLWVVVFAVLLMRARRGARHER